MCVQKMNGTLRKIYEGGWRVTHFLGVNVPRAIWCQVFKSNISSFSKIKTCKTWNVKNHLPITDFFVVLNQKITSIKHDSMFLWWYFYDASSWFNPDFSYSSNYPFFHFWQTWDAYQKAYFTLFVIYTIKKWNIKFITKHHVQGIFNL